MEKISYVFFVDFDGTISNIDVCHALVTNLAADGWQEINSKWENKELSTVECARQTFKLFKSNDVNDINSIIEPVTIDFAFRDFIAYCKNNGFPVYILSDGYDYYIRYLLSRENLALKYYANKLILEPDIDIEAPYHSACGNCGVCKTQLMERLQVSGASNIYIGDGYSDFCPSNKADIVFAKNTLLKHCLAEGIKAYPFQNFADVLTTLQSLGIGKAAP